MVCFPGGEKRILLKMFPYPKNLQINHPGIFFQGFILRVKIAATKKSFFSFYTAELYN